MIYFLWRYAMMISIIKNILPKLVPLSVFLSFPSLPTPHTDTHRTHVYLSLHAFFLHETECARQFLPFSPCYDGSTVITCRLSVFSRYRKMLYAIFLLASNPYSPSTSSASPPPPLYSLNNRPLLSSSQSLTPVCFSGKQFILNVKVSHTRTMLD